MEKTFKACRTASVVQGACVVLVDDVLTILAEDVLLEEERDVDCGLGVLEEELVLVVQLA